MRQIPGLLRLLCLLGALGLLAGCGEKVVGGRGTLRRGADGALDHLILEGSPYQIGWWHGRLLRDEIRALHGRWQTAAIRAQVGLARDINTGAAGDLKAYVDGFVDQTLHRMSERYRQELRGLADATGLSLEAVLFTEVMRDGLRIQLKQMEPQLPGILAAAERPAGPEGRAWWWGADAALLGDAWVVVERRPDTGPGTVLLSWPGSIGGMAGLSSAGVGYLLSEADVDGEFRGFNSGEPFPIVARRAIESGRDVDLVRALLKGTAGHALIVLSGPDEDGYAGRSAIGSVEIYRGVQDELDFAGKRRAFVIGPWQRVHAAMRRLKLGRGADARAAFDRQVFERAPSLIPVEARTGVLSARIRWTEDGVHFEVTPGDGAPRALVLRDGAFLAPEDVH